MRSTRYGATTVTLPAPRSLSAPNKEQKLAQLIIRAQLELAVQVVQYENVGAADYLKRPSFVLTVIEFAMLMRGRAVGPARQRPPLQAYRFHATQKGGVRGPTSLKLHLDDLPYLSDRHARYIGRYPVASWKRDASVDTSTAVKPLIFIASIARLDMDQGYLGPSVAFCVSIRQEG